MVEGERGYKQGAHNIFQEIWEVTTRCLTMVAPNQSRMNLLNFLLFRFIFHKLWCKHTILCSDIRSVLEFFFSSLSLDISCHSLLLFAMDFTWSHFMGWHHHHLFGTYKMPKEEEQTNSGFTGILKTLLFLSSLFF